MPKQIKYLENSIVIDDYLTLYEMFNDEEYISKAEELDDQLNNEIHVAIQNFSSNKKYLILTNMFDREEGEVFCNTIFRVTSPEVVSYEVMHLISKLGLLNTIEVGKNGINFKLEDEKSFMLFDYTKGVIEC